MNRSLSRQIGFGVVGAAMLALAACDVGKVVLFPWVEETKTDPAAAGRPDGPPPPPPPTTPVNPLDPDRLPEAPTVVNPAANTGAPEGGTPFVDKPENTAIPISDASTPVNAETGQPVKPLPPPADTPSGPNAGTGEPTAPAPTSTPAGPPPGPPPPTDPVNPIVFTPTFRYFAPSVLEPGSGIGSTEISALVPDMTFPIKDAPSYPQSQVYRYGGSVKGGDQCDPRNFSAPWRDTYCETRAVAATTPWCPSKGVHLGQDIRVGTPDGCKAEKAAKAADRTRYAVVAVEDGIISNVGSYSINIRASSGGRIYRYLHLNMAKLKVKTGQSVKRGDVVGYVSNDFGGTPTTLHLHFEINLNTAENGWQYAPPYESLLAAYQRREHNIGEKVADNFAVASAPGAPK
jgi:hypothetical protein